MTEAESRILRNSLMLGVNLLGIYAATFSEEKESPEVLALTRALLYDIGLPDIDIPSSREQRAKFVSFVIEILQTRRSFLASKGVRLGYALGTLDKSLIEQLPNALSDVKALARQVGISGDKIDRLVERRSSIYQADQGQILVEEIESWFPEPPDTENLRIFISHSSTDRDVASRLVELLRSALRLEASEIRCTSVPGYGLPVGVQIEEVLRGDVTSVQVFLGLISKSSLASLYVLFELGARWGSGKSILPVLLPGVEAADLKGPLANIHAITLLDPENVHQLIDYIGDMLNITPDKVGLHKKIVSLVDR
jgi:hypothetical protein